MQPAPKPTSSVLLEVDLGGAFTYALGRTFAGAGLDVAIGREFDSGFTIDGRFGLEAGGSQSGLPYQQLSWGVGFGGRISPRVRIAFEPHLGMLSIDRATFPGINDAMDTLTFGVRGEVVVALLGPGRRAERARAGGLDLIARVGWDGWVIDDAPGSVSNGVSLKLAIGGHF